MAICMNFHGCSGRPNRLNRIYHSGETYDGSYLLRWMRDTLGEEPTTAIGISLGGNMLACLLAKREEARLLSAAVIVSAPFHLDACSRRIEQGVSRIYQRYLVGQLKQKSQRKLARYPGSLPINPAQLQRAQLQRIKGLVSLMMRSSPVFMIFRMLPTTTISAEHWRCCPPFVRRRG
ncbi:MAG: alpha/beta fold hydrolase [Symbiopectobacterium sp.]